MATSGTALLALTCALLPLVVGCGEGEPAVRPNILLITVDSLRADHLGCYGHTRDTSPRIDRLAADGVLYRNAIAQASWTLPSMATLLTSRYPSHHGADSAGHSLPEEVTTLAEVLRDQGYKTLGFVSHLFVGRKYGMDQGFDLFDQRHIAGHSGVTSEGLTDTALRRLRREGKEPFFLWVHYFDPHFTYVQHEEFAFTTAEERGSLKRELTILYLQGRTNDISAEELSYVEGVYDEEIAYTDHQIGRLLDRIEALPTVHPLVTVFTADHGEAFLERGRFGHGHDVYDELIRVPLLISGAIDEGLKGTACEAPVELASVAGTIARLAGVRGEPFRGEDLLALDTLSNGPRFRFAEGNSAWSDEDRQLAVISNGWKLIRHLEDGRLELYDLAADPREANDLSGSSAEAVVARREVLVRALDRFAASGSVRGGELDLEHADLEHLESLGYTR
jgi:arylsulfatase A-like enzyme